MEKEISLKTCDEITQKKYIIERMGKYLIKYNLLDLLDVYLKVKEDSVKKEMGN